MYQTHPFDVINTLHIADIGYNDEQLFNKSHLHFIGSA